MRSIVAALAAISFFGFGADTISFDLKEGTMPPYWTATVTPSSAPQRTAPRWEIVHDRTAPSHQTAFAQVESGVSAGEFPLAIYDKVIAVDADLSVKFKITGGRKARSASLVFRYQDPDNYYALEFSADESKVALLHVENGEAHPVPILGSRKGEPGVIHPVKTGEWYIAKVSYRGRRFRVYFGERWLFDALDEGLLKPGKTGLRTHDGTTAEFDDFRVERKR